MREESTAPSCIQVRGAKVHNLKNIDVDVPLNKRNADYMIDMGSGGGEAGGRIVAAGTPEQVAKNPDSVTGRFL